MKVAILNCVFATDTDSAEFDEATGEGIWFISLLSLELMMISQVKIGWLIIPQRFWKLNK